MSNLVVAVFGTNGFLGKPIINALKSKQFLSSFTEIRAITRDTSKYEDSDLVKYYKADSANIDSFKDALTGVDVLINVGPPNEYYDNVFDAAIKFANLKLYIPSQFGTELDVVDLPNFLDGKTKHSEKARAAGIKTIDFITSLFAVPGVFLYEDISILGYDDKTKTAVIRGDKDFRFDISYLPDIGNAVAAIVAKGDYSSLPDKLRISSDKITQEDVLKRYEETHNIAIKREYKSKAETYKEGTELFAKGFNFKDFFFYLQFFLSQGVDKGISFSKNDDELVNPGESLFKWTKWASN